MRNKFAERFESGENALYRATKKNGVPVRERRFRLRKGKSYFAATMKENSLVSFVATSVTSIVLSLV